MNETTKALLSIMQAQKGSISASDMIIHMKQEKNLNMTHHHINILLARKKIERVGIGKYQIVNNQN